MTCFYVYSIKKYRFLQEISLREFRSLFTQLVMHPTIPLNRFLPYQNIPTNSSTALVFSMFFTNNLNKIYQKKSFEAKNHPSPFPQVTLPPIAIVIGVTAPGRSRTLTPTMAETAKVAQQLVNV